MDLKALMEERASLVEEYQELVHEDEFSEESTERCATIEARIGDIDAALDRLEKADELGKRAAERAARTGEPAPTGDGRTVEPAPPPNAAFAPAEARRLALQAWAMADAGDLDISPTDDMRRAADQVGLDIHQRSITVALSDDGHRTAESRVMGVDETGTPAEGAEMVPEGFAGFIESALLANSEFRQIATVLRTDSGNAIPVPTDNDTGNDGENVSEASDFENTADVTVSEVTLNAYKVSSKFVNVSPELIEDSAFAIEPWLGSKLGQRIARQTNANYTTGSGSSTAYGIVTELAAGTENSHYIKTASNDTLAVADLESLEHAVDPAYRSLGCSWMMHDSILKSCKSLQEDSKTLGYWTDRFYHVEGGRPYLLDYPVYYNQDMASSVADAANIITFGLHSKYMIRDVKTVRITKLVERYAELGQIAFVAILRTDGHLLDAGTHPVVLLQVQ